MAKKIETDLHTVDLMLLKILQLIKCKMKMKIIQSLKSLIILLTLSDNEISKAEFDTLDKSKYKTKSVTELEDNKEQYDVGIDILKYYTVDMTLDENDNQPETKITYNLDDIVDNVA